jgi:hypothetical protein
MYQCNSVIKVVLIYLSALVGFFRKIGCCDLFCNTKENTRCVKIRVLMYSQVTS